MSPTVTAVLGIAFALAADFWRIDGRVLFALQLAAVYQLCLGVVAAWGQQYRLSLADKYVQQTIRSSDQLKDLQARIERDEQERAHVCAHHHHDWHREAGDTRGNA